MVKVGKISMMVIAGLLGAAAVQAKASTITVATYIEDPSNSGTWSYSNTTGTLSVSEVADSNVFLLLNPSLYNVPILQSVNVSGTATRLAGPSGDATSSGGNVSQAVTGTITFTSQSSGKVLLSVAYNGALILGQDGSGSGHLGGGTISGQIITYSADPTVLTIPFPAPGAQNNTFSLSLDLNTGLLGVGANNNLNSFTATSGGSFLEESSGTPGTPLPASAWSGMALIAGLGLAGRVVRRRQVA
jgi:hypothetical protein